MPDARCSVTRRSRWGAIAPRSSMTSEPPSSAPHVDHDQVMQGINAVLGADYREKLRLSAFTEHNATTYTYTPNTSMKDAIQPRQWRRKGSVGPVVSVVEGAPPTEEPRPDAQATRGVNGPPQGQLACPVCSCLCVETPVVAHKRFALPRSSILCGCINMSLAGKLMRCGVDALPHVRRM
jgi:hypothetical protein